MATIKDIAKEAGVSLGTVSNVLNKKNNVRLRKIELVENAIKKLGYQKNTQASILKSGTNNKISIIFPNISSSEYYSLYEALDFYFSAQGYRINLYLTNNDKVKEEKIIEIILGEPSQVIITSSCLVDAKSYYDLLDDKKTDIIFVYNKLKGARNYINFDYDSIFYDVIEQIYKDGYSCAGTILKNKNYHSEKIKLFYFKNDGPFEIVNFVIENKLPAIITISLEKAEEIYNAFYFSNLVPPKIYTITGAKFSYDNRFVKYYVSYESIAKKIINKVKGEKINGNYLNKGFQFLSCNKISNKVLNILSIPSPSTDALQKIIPHFTRQTGIRVNLHTVSFQEISTILSNPRKYEKYDIVRIDMERLPCLYHSLQPMSFIPLSELEEYYSKNIIDRFCLVNKIFYAIPFDPSIQVLFYHKDLFEDMVIRRMYYEIYKEELNPPTDFDEFNKISSFFRNTLFNNFSVKYGTSIIDNYEILALEFFIRYYAVANENIFINGKSFFNKENALLVLEKLSHLMDSAILVEDNWWSKAVELFEKRETAMLIIYANHYSQLSNSLPASIGCVPVPGKKPLIGGGSLAITRNCQKCQEAELFLNWFLSDEINEMYALLGGVSARKNTFLNQEIIKRYPWIPTIEQLDFNGIRENTIATDKAINLIDVEKKVGCILFEYLTGKFDKLVSVEKLNNVFSEAVKS